MRSTLAHSQREVGTPRTEKTKLERISAGNCAGILCPHCPIRDGCVTRAPTSVSLSMSSHDTIWLEPQDRELARTRLAELLLRDMLEDR